MEHENDGVKPILVPNLEQLHTVLAKKKYGRQTKDKTSASINNKDA